MEKTLRIPVKAAGRRQGKEHWMVTVARAAGLPRAESLELEPTTAPGKAWAYVSGLCGLSQYELAEHVAGYYRYKVANLAQAESKAVKLVSEKMARSFHIFPIREDDLRIVVATARPMDFEAEQSLGFSTSRRAVFEIAPPGAIAEAIDASYSPDRVIENLVGRLDSKAADDVQFVEEAKPEEVTETEVVKAPVMQLTGLILRNAVREGASDIHFEPTEHGAVVRFRIEGLLRESMKLPLAAFNRVVSRLKVMGDMDIADRHRPQDGHARINVEGHNYDLRISTIPTRGTEKAVIRVLDSEKSIKLGDLQLPSHELKRLRRMLSQPNGIVVVTGPTGSGKTTTLYAGLREILTADRNIMTVEDPIEYQISGITQIQVKKQRGVTFAAALRSILRQDPDVILVGEIRDAETASVAAQAAMTGHLVLATLHTNDAVSSINRLTDLGLSRATVAGVMRGAVSQRLIRKICRDCATLIIGELTPEEHKMALKFGVEPIVRPVGCKNCGETGYRGRVPIDEVMVVDSAMEEMIANNAGLGEIQRAANSEGMRSLRAVALEKVRKGHSTLEEVERVLGEVSEEDGGKEPDRPTILVVDDDSMFRDTTRAILEEHGFKVSEAESGEKALEQVDAGRRVDLLLLDLNMPGMGGQAVLSRLKKEVATAALPVVILTASEQANDEVRAMEMGAEDYVNKPASPPRLVARIKAALRRARD